METGGGQLRQRVHAEIDDVLKGLLPIRDESKYPSYSGNPNAPEPEPLGTLGYRSAASALLIVGPGLPCPVPWTCGGW